MNTQSLTRCLRCDCTFVSPRPRVTAKTFYIPMDDVNSDRVGDLVFSSAAGGGPKGPSELALRRFRSGRRSRLGRVREPSG